MRISPALFALSAFLFISYPVCASAHPEISHRIEALEKELKTSPSPQGCSQLVDLLFAAKDCGKGFSQGEECLRSHPQDVPLSFATARVAICARNFTRAEELLGTLKASEGSTLHWGFLNIYLQESHGTKADLLASITNLIELQPSVEPHIYLRAVTLGRAIEPKQSARYLTLLRKGIANHPKSLSLRMGLLSIQESSNMNCDALKTIDEIIKEFPTLNQQQWLSRKNTASTECRKSLS